MYGLRLNYSGVKIDHQNDESPLINEYREIEIPLIFDDNINIQLLKWKTIKYTEEKGLFGTFEKKYWENLTNIMEEKFFLIKK